MASAFFYGTLMHPKILKQVIGHDGSYLQIRSAVLLILRTIRDIKSMYAISLLRYSLSDDLQGEDYPGMVPYTRSREMFSDDLKPEERCVKGSVVIGLSARDMRALDIFEGNEYTRELVLVHPLGPSTSLDDVEAVTEDTPIPQRDKLASALEVNTYVWCQLSQLQPKLWTLEEFIQESAWKWIGTGSKDNRYYNEVERRRDMDGTITHQ